MATSTYDIAVTNPNGLSGALADAFMVSDTAAFDFRDKSYYNGSG